MLSVAENKESSMIPKTKGDYMSLVEEIDPRVRVMDSAIPLKVSEELYALGIDSSMMVMVYWVSGKQEVVNIAAHWAYLENNK